MARADAVVGGDRGGVEVGHQVRHGRAGQATGGLGEDQYRCGERVEAVQDPLHDAERPKLLIETPVQDADVVVTMGCGDQCRFYPGKRYEDWVLDDPAGEGSTQCGPCAAVASKTGGGLLSVSSRYFRRKAVAGGPSVPAPKPGG